MEIENYADPLDRAASITEAENLQRIQEHLNRMRSHEAPDEDADGTRYCLDCAEVIDPRRVEAVNAVRCVPCVEKLESLDDRRLRHGGGMNHIVESVD